MNDSAVTVPGDRFFRNLGLCVVGIGIVGLIRMVPEAWSLWSTGGRTYVQFLALDFLLSAFSVGAGIGMTQAWKHGATLAAIGAGGATLTNTFAMLVYLAPFFWSTPGVLMLFLPRLMFYAITIGFWPYGIRAAFRALPSAGGRRWVLLGCAGAISGLFSGMVINY